MSGNSTTFQPSGRGELLLWINGVCSTQYPSIESLRDGVAYCTITDAAVSRVAENCKALGVPEAHIAQTRAKRSSQLLARLEWNVTLATCSKLEPSLDSMQERDQCEKNFHTLQLMLRGCMSPEFSLEIDVLRLAAGKFQEHIKLLKWMYQFMTKMLSTYSRSALEQRVCASLNAGCVEGVKMTRTMKLKQKRIEGNCTRFASPESMPQKETCSENGVNVVYSPPSSRNIRGRKPKQVSTCAIPSTENAVKPLKEKWFEATSPHQATHMGIIEKQSQCHFQEVPQIGRGFCKFPQSSQSRCTSPVLIRVSHASFTILTDLRNDVESYERLIFSAHKRHQSSLMDSQNIKGKIVKKFTIKPRFEKELLPYKHSMISLQEFGALLDERDKLWQTLEVVQDALAQCALGVEKKDWSEITASPLVENILQTLAPP